MRQLRFHLIYSWINISEAEGNGVSKWYLVCSIERVKNIWLVEQKAVIFCWLSTLPSLVHNILNFLKYWNFLWTFLSYLDTILIYVGKWNYIQVLNKKLWLQITVTFYFWIPITQRERELTVISFQIRN
jgi:hypothetical protein